MFRIRPLVFAMLALLLAGAPQRRPLISAALARGQPLCGDRPGNTLATDLSLLCGTDGWTLKKMLERWATDSRMTLTYQPTSITPCMPRSPKFAPPTSTRRPRS